MTDTRVFYVNVPLHDVAILNIVPDTTMIEQNQTTPINVTVSNLGNYTETCTVTLTCDSEEVGLQSLTLNTWDLQILTFEWNTTGTSTQKSHLESCRKHGFRRNERTKQHLHAELSCYHNSRIPTRHHFIGYAPGFNYDSHHVGGEEKATLKAVGATTHLFL